MRIVIHFPAGGSTDLVARTLAQALTESMGQPFVVENRTGADGAIAAAAVMQAPPDGHTLFIATNTAMLQVPLLQKKPPYDPLTSFTPVSLVGRYTFLLVVTPSLGVKTFDELIAYARKNPGKVNFATYSGASQLAYAQIIKTAGVDMLRVPYKGEAPSVIDLLGGQVHAVFATPTSSAVHIRDGKLRALAVTTVKRDELLPDLAPVADTVPGYESSAWFGIGAPHGTPPELVALLNKTVNAGLADPKMRARYTELGGGIVASSPAAFGKLIAEETEKWGKVVKFAGLKPV